MKLTTSGVTYELDQYTLTNTELIAIERATGMTMRQWINGLIGESVIAFTAFVWIVQRRAEPLLDFEDVEFGLVDIQLDLDDEEPGKDEAGPASSNGTSSRSPSDSESGPGRSDASSTATPSP